MRRWRTCRECRLEFDAILAYNAHLKMHIVELHEERADLLDQMGRLEKRILLWESRRSKNKERQK